ncbi:SDR family oxidoreductase [Pseudactinotalea suaedae]|uniref:SDR family oxidoreductase n=1 Tax=Pseudactinotalea suaedae TaxID=1524924 RepID=UPI0012E16AD2|nr:SDR family oxidoreductase [Pseudactinotalea suaedae]
MPKRAVITGASSGIGAATVRALRAAGWDVVGVARREDKLAALAQETGADVVVADLTRQQDVETLRDHLAATGPVHALVNNAGGAYGMNTVEASPVEDWVRMLDVNVIATKRVTSALLPLLRDSLSDADSPGCADILTVTSTAARSPYEGGAGYNAAKAAASMLVQVLRLELAGEPIRVVEIAPGMVRTEEFSLTRFDGDAERAAQVYEGVEDPLSAEDVAATITATLELAPHVNLDLVTIKPVAQAATHKVARGPLRVRATD